MSMVVVRLVKIVNYFAKFLSNKSFFTITFFLLSFSTQILSQFNYEQFTVSDLADFQLVNNATLEGNKIRLTLNSGGQIGACWYKTKQQLDEGFETEFTFQISDIGGWNGGDGFAFVIQNYTNDALGESGGAIGYSGIPNSLAIEFDTWRNYGDPNDNHISVQTKGTEPNDSDQSASIGYTTEIPDLSNGEIHRVKITYQPPLIEIYIDSLNSAPVLSVNINLTDTLQLDNGRAWIGFTAATGSAYEKHYILSWKFTPTNFLGITDETVTLVPKYFVLHQNYPNPFNPVTFISFSLPKESEVKIEIYNLLGELLAVLVNERKAAGNYTVVFDGSNLPSGIYYYRLITDKRFMKTKKMLLLK